ncbi:MAG: RsmB/NOP family class I SAM-dependent RNA methyltransferase [Planctomycetes bacterium]|nr:RsmB/NOP family class I SAM-dependent RNA methyltransferase [Planctomycetota bacterium]
MRSPRAAHQCLRQPRLPRREVRGAGRGEPARLDRPRPHPDWKILDACAGAGGKTLHLSNLMGGKGEIFAYEPDARRREELRKRARRADAQNVRLVDRAAIPARVDAVLVDAPCSGMGTIRRNPMIKNRLAPADCERHSDEQVAILAEYAARAPLVLYATCSLARAENEGVVEHFLAAHGGWTQEAAETLLPHRDGCDGFFHARLRAMTRF